jgi:hypothetical protein
MLMQLLSHNSTHVTPNAGRPAASWQAGAGKEKKYENPISQIAQFGGEMKSRFSQILKKTLIHIHMALAVGFLLLGSARNKFNSQV